MSSSTAVVRAAKRREIIAPWWHTLLVIAALAALSAASRYQKGLPNVHLPGMNSRLSSYFTAIAAQWLLIFMIWLVLRQRGLSMERLVSGRWHSARAFFRDLGLAIGYLVVIAVPISVLAASYAGNTKATIMPNTGFELVTWLAASATAGFCEEFIFRGYLTEQFRAWSGSRPFAIVLQALLFGLSHGHYNKAVTLFVMLIGLTLGLFAYWRKSLRPGMLAHGLLDALGGIVVFFTRM